MRDYIGYGFSRIVLLLMVATSYLILYFAKPGVSDSLLYAWMLQYGGGRSEKQFLILSFKNQN